MCAPENRGGPRTETRRTKGEFYVGRRRTHGTQRAAPEKRETGWVRESTGCCGKPLARTMNASVSCVAGHGTWSNTAVQYRKLKSRFYQHACAVNVRNQLLSTSIYMYFEATPASAVQSQDVCDVCMCTFLAGLFVVWGVRRAGPSRVHTHSREGRPVVFFLILPRSLPPLAQALNLAARFSLVLQ